MEQKRFQTSCLSHPLDLFLLNNYAYPSNVCRYVRGNTGTIARTCAATRVPLHLVGPLGFELTDSQLKRAGLDYWNSVCVKVHDDWVGGPSMCTHDATRFRAQLKGA